VNTLQAVSGCESFLCSVQDRLFSLGGEERNTNWDLTATCHTSLLIFTAAVVPEVLPEFPGA
jgi:hypothetical protein